MLAIAMYMIERPQVYLVKLGQLIHNIPLKDDGRMPDKIELSIALLAFAGARAEPENAG